ncbi:MAG: amino acid ABC transporter permease [Proteobacteria bacterium]|nr:amino acid ABC transporter permease [Pseudomonadota bacterium]MBU1584778.1 amino acid ABC transporter permease [Pseudomonadota bacterium]MBU2452326.1 amino acid ABC transporter permease [Pseudomonadota bacterium]
MELHAINETMVTIKPPISNIGILGWMRKNLFSSPVNTILTLLILSILWFSVLPFLKWALIDSTWLPDADCRGNGGGACWSIISSNYKVILFGFYPQDILWRPVTAIFMLISLLVLSRNRNFWNAILGYAWIISLVIMGILLKGGVFGLAPVDIGQWGGIILTLLLSVFGLTAAYPLGILLALGRQSKMPVIKTFCIFYIELIRGVPLISLLFMSSVVFPLFLPEGVSINGILRAQVAIIMFTAAYIAEVVRGGLQGMNKGQFEAADAIGLNYSQTMRLVILPQALKIVIPPSVSVLISAFKDTSLVVIIGLYDLLKTTQSTLSEPKWMGFSAEAYIFLALIYFICCFFMSNYSRKLEKELDTSLE